MTFARLLAVLALPALLSACGGDEVDFAVPDTAARFSYDVVIENAPNAEVQSVAEETLDLYLRQDDGTASPAFLRRRADSDLPTLVSRSASRSHPPQPLPSRRASPRPSRSATG